MGPLINSHSHKHSTPPLHLLPWKYMSAREYIFLSHAPCVYRYNKEKFVRRKMYSLALVFSFWKFQKIRGVTSPFSTDLTPPNLTDLEHHVMDWLTCNQRIIVFILPMSKLKVGSSGFSKIICLLHSDSHCSFILIWGRRGFQTLLMGACGL